MLSVVRQACFLIWLLPLGSAGNRVEAYVIEKDHSLDAQTHWKDMMQDSFDSIFLVDPVYPSVSDIDRMIKGGRVDANYASRFVSREDTTRLFKDAASTIKSNPKIAHELGCSESHRKVWERFSRRFEEGRGGPWAAVFEGDASVREDFSERTKELISKLPQETVDIIYMGHCFEDCAAISNTSSAEISLGGSVNLFQSKTAWCTHYYLVSYQGAKRLLNLTKNLYSAVDNLMQDAFKGLPLATTTLTSLSSCPALAHQPWQSPNEFKEIFAPKRSSEIVDVSKGQLESVEQQAVQKEKHQVIENRIAQVTSHSQDGNRFLHPTLHEGTHDSWIVLWIAPVFFMALAVWKAPLFGMVSMCYYGSAKPYI
jgi:GR25 family glycosyltransferase involved in LPS biosynthesis